MRLSSILAPTSRNNPAKVKDQRLIRLVRAGYAVYDNSAGKILLTPLGIRILERVSGKIKAAFEEKGSQQISGCQSKDAPFEVMVRVLKIKDQLPVTLMEEKNRKIDLTGFAPDEDILSMKMEDHIQACREVLFSGGIKVFSISEITPEGKRYARIVDGEVYFPLQLKIMPLLIKNIWKNLKKLILQELQLSLNSAGSWICLLHGH